MTRKGGWPRKPCSSSTLVPPSCIAVHRLLGAPAMFPSRKPPGGSGKVAALASELQQRAHPLRGPSELDPLLERIGDAQYVLLGEASHGTSEYYTWRAELSKRLIREKGFSFIAVEGDWPDCYRVNRYAKGYADSGASAREVLHA